MDGILGLHHHQNQQKQQQRSMEVVDLIEELYSKYILDGCRFGSSEKFLEKLAPPSIRYLTSIMNQLVVMSSENDTAPYEVEAELDNNEVQLDRISTLIAALSSLSGLANNSKYRKFYFFEKHGIRVDIQETSYDTTYFGWKTWNAAIVLCKMLDSKDTRIQLFPSDQRILELGCGTGLLGITCAKLGAQRVYMTDYMDEIIDNTRLNLSLNQVDDRTEVCRLDWFNLDQHTLPRIPSTNEDVKFEVIVASDVCYEQRLADRVPTVIRRFLAPTSSTARAYVVVQHRGHTFSKELELFEQGVAREGMRLEIKRDFNREIGDYFMIYTVSNKL